jgi:hypothetical protein
MAKVTLAVVISGPINKIKQQKESHHPYANIFKDV